MSNSEGQFLYCADYVFCHGEYGYKGDCEQNERKEDECKIKIKEVEDGQE